MKMGDECKKRTMKRGERERKEREGSRGFEK